MNFLALVLCIIYTEVSGTVYKTNCSFYKPAELDKWLATCQFDRRIFHEHEQIVLERVDTLLTGTPGTKGGVVWIEETVASCERIDPMSTSSYKCSSAPGYTVSTPSSRRNTLTVTLMEPPAKYEGDFVCKGKPNNPKETAIPCNFPGKKYRTTCSIKHHVAPGQKEVTCHFRTSIGLHTEIAVQQYGGQTVVECMRTQPSKSFICRPEVFGYTGRFDHLRNTLTVTFMESVKFKGDYICNVMLFGQIDPRVKTTPCRLSDTGH